MGPNYDKAVVSLNQRVATTVLGPDAVDGGGSNVGSSLSAGLGSALANQSGLLLNITADSTKLKRKKVTRFLSILRSEYTFFISAFFMQSILEVHLESYTKVPQK